MKAPETLRELVARFTGLGFRVVFMDRAPMDAVLYGAGWGVYVFEKEGWLWQLVPSPSKKLAVVSRLG
ncbi:hypothetical protein Pyrde_0705 [Pyrodictium delaneyi]|uniref:Uncharacterized protein n=1 Tax=Pyrodictium delaneyi TaxID=1273541 RepID=A0A0P0N3A7_9CREN|nr:hypothetical protein [Pyrodictium delaneyi]ALL00755.1 hypothetical protein Pyrde_0705 [Pyrodictium delaneyi]